MATTTRKKIVKRASNRGIQYPILTPLTVKKLMAKGLAVLSKLTPPKTSKEWRVFKAKRKAEKSVVKDAETGCECNPCLVGHDGFVFCWDGEIRVLDDFPSTGGPWAPAVQPNGQVVWLNAAALEENIH